MIEVMVIAAAALLAAGGLWRPALRHSAPWRAMITPLASIIGSGFLVLGPLLVHAYGAWAPVVMAGLCGLAYALGHAIRFTIAVVGAGTHPPGRLPRLLEDLASAALGAAYVVSVAYYLNLFGAFAVRLTPVNDPLVARLVTSAAYGVILWFGWRRGFAALESLEYGSVTLKLAVIAGLLAGLAVFFGGHLGDLHAFAAHETGWSAVTLAFGLIVTVQGFETARYLGETYDPPTRIAAMRRAQWLSAAIYMGYVILLAGLFAPDPADLSETAIIGMMARVSPVLPWLLVMGALAAQFSAAVADTGGAGGLAHDLSDGRIRAPLAYLGLVGVGLAITWGADVFTIIALASRAFAAYYAIQAAIAALLALRVGARGRAVFYGGLAVLAVAMALFGRAVEGA